MALPNNDSTVTDVSSSAFPERWAKIEHGVMIFDVNPSVLYANMHEPCVHYVDEIRRNEKLRYSDIASYLPLHTRKIVSPIHFILCKRPS